MFDPRNTLYVLATSISGLLLTGLLILALVTMPVSAATDFPVAPAATARGLQQLDMAALRKAFTGTHVEQDARQGLPSAIR
jgi:hypothetical protein